MILMAKFHNKAEFSIYNTQIVARLAILDKGINTLKEVSNNLDKKIMLLIKNDPVYELSNDINHPLVLNYVSRWPLACFILFSCFCLGCSAVYHLFQIHSDGA